MEQDMGILDIDPRLWIGGDSLSECLDELGLPLPDMAIACTELLVEVSPSYQRPPVKVVQPEGQPDIDIERGGAILQFLDRSLPKRHGMAAYLLEKIAIE